MRPLDQCREFFLPHASGVGLTIASMDASAQAKSTKLEPGFAKLHGFIWVEKAGTFCRASQRQTRQHTGDSESRTFKELTPRNCHTKNWVTLVIDCAHKI
jgi:hypothetical protein